GETRPMPSLPSISVITRACARLGSWTAMPCTSATDCANSAVDSMKPTVSAPESARVTPVPMPGITAVAPTAAPPAVTAARYRVSRMPTICAGGASGCRRRMLRMCATTSGRCTERMRSSPLTGNGRAAPAAGAAACDAPSWMMWGRWTFSGMRRSYARRPRESREPPLGEAALGASRVWSHEEVRALQVLGEVDLHRVQVGDVHRLEQQAVLGDRQLESALEVVLVIDALELAHERLLVGGRDV